MDICLAFLHLAQTTTSPEVPGPGGSYIHLIVMFIGVLAIMYFLVSRPQKKRETEQRKMQDSLKKKDRAVTVGGIHGVVKSVSGDVVNLTVDESSGVNIKVAKTAVARLLPKEEETSKDDKLKG